MILICGDQLSKLNITTSSIPAKAVVKDRPKGQIELCIVGLTHEEFVVYYRYILSENASV